MNKNAKRENQYFIFFHILENETKTQASNKWVTIYFPQARMKSLVSILVKINLAQSDAISDANTGWVADNTKDRVSGGINAWKIIQIGW